MTTSIKICGITQLEDAQLAAELGASHLGFNFYPPSPRYIGPAKAKEIIRQLPSSITAVGVFADEADDAYVAKVAREAGVSTIQLGGPTFPPLEKLKQSFSLIRVVAVAEGFDLEDLKDPSGATILLDAYHPTLRGGTGTTFDWSLARQATNYAKIILAGGLTPENVGQAIREVRPFAVDVATGVESAPGKKDAAKLRAFFAAVTQADKGN